MFKCNSLSYALIIEYLSCYLLVILFSFNDEFYVIDIIQDPKGVRSSK